jgi:hypothetical protein
LRPLQQHLGWADFINLHFDRNFLMKWFCNFWGKIFILQFQNIDGKIFTFLAHPRKELKINGSNPARLQGCWAVYAAMWLFVAYIIGIVVMRI